MKVAVLQPGYLPWIGFFDQMRRVETFVLYDDVQYDKNSWRNRNRIKTASGPVWLTVPVLTAGRFGQSIAEVRIDNRTPWRKRHWNTISQAYARAPHFAEHRAFFADLYAAEWDSLVELDCAIIGYLARELGIATRLVRASMLPDVSGRKNDRLLAICDTLGATAYLSGDAAESYLDRDRFAAAGIAVSFQRYEHPVYPQLHGPFVPYLSALDLLFACGPDSARWLSPQTVEATR